jgi:pyrroline-5-carboxylate reductase
VLGTAILTGILASLESRPRDDDDKRIDLTKRFLEGNLTPSSSGEGCPPDRPTRFIACVRTADSASRVEKEISAYSTPVTILYGENLKAVREADFIVLGCLPYQLEECVGEPKMRDALRGKLLVSLLAGVIISRIEETLYRGLSETKKESFGCRIVRAMPNTAACVRESMTVITTQQSDPQTMSLVNWLFESIGEVAHISEEVFDACTALCGSGPAFFALVLEAMVDAAVSLGVKRAEAQVMAAHAMKGTSSLIISGEHPAMVRESVASPGGSTMVGLLKLEEGRARSTISNALINCADAARGVGKR